MLWAADCRCGRLDSVGIHIQLTSYHTSFGNEGYPPWVAKLTRSVSLLFHYIHLYECSRRLFSKICPVRYSHVSAHTFDLYFRQALASESY